MKTTTFSQRGLALHLELDVSTIRRRGNEVMGYARDADDPKKAHREIWKRVNYQNGRLHLYELVKSYERPSC